MNELKVFTNEECGEIRAMKRDGEAWFVAVDVCNALDIKNARQAVTRLDDDENAPSFQMTVGKRSTNIQIQSEGR